MSTWTPAEEALARRLIADGLDCQQVADEFAQAGLRRTHQSIRRKKQREGWHARVRPGPPQAERYNKQVSVEADRALLLFDIHAPFHDAAFLNDLIDIGLRERVTLAGVGGDLVDFTAFSSYGRQLGIEASDELDSAEHVITTLARCFERVVYSGGNHEYRLVRKVDHLLSLSRVMELFVNADNVTITDYHWFELTSGGERFYIEHPKNASVIPGRVPVQLCAKFHKHVIAGHGHTWGMTRDVSGNYYAIDAGVCCDPLKLGYIQQVHSTRPQVMQGAVLVLDGVPWLLNPDTARAWRSRIT